MQDQIKRQVYFKTWQWVLCAFTASFTFGYASFLYASRFSHLGFKGNGIFGPGCLLLNFPLKAIWEGQYRYRHGRWFKAEQSAWRTPEGGWYWTNLVPMTLNAVVNFLFLIVMTFSWQFAKVGGINQGIISTLVSLSAVMNIVAFRVLFKEKVTVY